MDLRAQIEAKLGLNTVTFKHNLSPATLFHEAIANDKGRITKGGADNEQKAYPTKLGINGPLVFYSDPSCTGRPVQDTFCVDRASITDKVW